MNRIDALTYAFNDTARPANERDAALAALRSLVTDGSDEAERRQARAAIDSLESNPPEDAPCPLENELLFGCHATSLADIEHYHLHEFVSAHRGNPDADRLYQKWLRVSPIARQKMQQMQKHLENYFCESYDRMLKKYKAALDSGCDLNAANSEALRFYRDWVDSCVTPQELRPHFRELITALSARCEGHHDKEK